MADVFTPEKRSQVMSRIRGSNTQPEVVVRALLHRKGYRFTVNGPLNRSLPGRPDIVLPKYKTVIFVHGCFWHAHEGCPYFKLPSTRPEFWENKILGNKSRDLRHEETLCAMGWHVVTIWECALRTKVDQAWLADQLDSLIQ